MKTRFLAAALAALIASQTAAQRLVVLTPDTAEIVAELGSAGEVAGIHEHNRHAAYRGKPSVGFYRTLSSAPIVAQKPDLVIGSFMATPPTIYQRLRQAGVKAENVNPQETLQDYLNGIVRTGRLLGKEQQAQQLAAKFRAAVKQQPSNGKRYLLSYDGRYAAGRNTVGDTLIRLSGGINAAASVDGLKPLSREAWLAAKPDIVIVAKHNEAAVGGIQKIAARPELASSNAARNGKILFWNADEFLRFGLHTPESIKRLNALGR